MNKIIREINQIIERDSKNTSYKFALLRGTIEIIQSNSPFVKEIEGRIHLPLGLLVERWLMYYYPLVNAEMFIPQRQGEKRQPGSWLAFRPQMETITSYYSQRGGLPRFFFDLRDGCVPNKLSAAFIKLADKIEKTIKRQPIQYIGSSIQSSEEIYKTHSRKIWGDYTVNSPGIKMLINRYGSFSIPIEYFQVFKVFGSFLTGYQSILFHWADFTEKVSKGNISQEVALRYLLVSPALGRDLGPLRKFYNQELDRSGKLYCVWTGKALKNKFEIDHLIPFSVWSNNDMWNLLPASAQANRSKSDKIPSPQLLSDRKKSIIQYWTILDEVFDDRFKNEVYGSLLGNEVNSKNWLSLSFDRVTDNCAYLIEERGFLPWNGLDH